MAEGGYPNKIKRPCLEDVTLSLGPCAHSSNPCAELQAPPLAMNPGSAGPPLLLETNPLNSGALDSPLVVPLAADMGLKGPAGPYYDRVSSMPPVDQELRDLLEELTKIPEPSCSELDLEKILGRKPEEPLLLDQPQVPTQMPHLGSLASREELASSCSHAVGVSLPMPPCSAGLGYSRPSTSGQVPSPSSSTAQAENQGPATIPVALAPPPVPQWRHAQQLKALAASKQGSATRSHRPAASWSGLPPLGPSPPSRPAPSQQPPPPFSSQNLLASCMSPGASVSSMASSRTSALGPNVPYAPEKLPQPPPLSPQSAILASLMASPTSNPGPSPPYGPEQRCSPGLPQQSFTPQCNSARALAAAGGPLRPLSPLRPQPPAPPASASSKALSTSPAKTLSMIVRQGLAGPSPAAPEPFPFGSTKPLSHFVSEPGPEKAPSMPSMPAASRQPSLLHYLQQPTPAQSPAAIATATAILEQQPPSDRSALLLQQMVQQSQCLPRAAALDAMPSLSRQTHVDKACKLGEARPPQASLRRQPPSCQALGSESFLPGSSFAQELARVTSSHSDSEVASWGGWDLKAWRQAPAPPLPSCDAAEKQSSGLPAMIPEQGSEYLAQHLHQFQAVQEEVTSKCSCSRSSCPSRQHVTPSRPGLLPHSLIPRVTPPAWYQGLALPDPPFPTPTRSGQTLLASPGPVPQRAQCPEAVLWAAAVSKGAPLGAPAFPSQQAAVVPSPVALGGRPGRKVSATLAHPHFSLLGVPKTLRQGTASFSPLSPIQGIEPPSCVASAAATATAATVTASLSPGPFDRVGAPPGLPPPCSVPVSPDCASPDEDWACNCGPPESPTSVPPATAM